MVEPMKNGLLAVIGCVVLVACGGGDKKDKDTDSKVDTTPRIETRVDEKVEETVAAFVPDAKQFALESFKIVYALEGQTTGTRTMYVEAHGDRVAIVDDVVVYNKDDDRLTYWDGDNVYLQTLPDGKVSKAAIRPITTEPSSFAITSASDLQGIGYVLQGDKTVAGVECEHWVNTSLNYNACRWNRIDFEMIVGEPERPVQKTRAIDFEAGVGIPDDVKAVIALAE